MIGYFSSAPAHGTPATDEDIRRKQRLETYENRGGEFHASQAEDRRAGSGGPHHPTEVDSDQSNEPVPEGPLAVILAKHQAAISKFDDGLKALQGTKTSEDIDCGMKKIKEVAKSESFDRKEFSSMQNELCPPKAAHRFVPKLILRHCQPHIPLATKFANIFTGQMVEFCTLAQQTYFLGGEGTVVCDEAIKALESYRAVAAEIEQDEETRNRFNGQVQATRERIRRHRNSSHSHLASLETLRGDLEYVNEAMFNYSNTENKEANRYLEMWKLILRVGGTGLLCSVASVIGSAAMELFTHSPDAEQATVITYATYGVVGYVVTGLSCQADVLDLSQNTHKDGAALVTSVLPTVQLIQHSIEQHTDGFRRMNQALSLPFFQRSPGTDDRRILDKWRGVRLFFNEYTQRSSCINEVVKTHGIAAAPYVGQRQIIASTAEGGA